MRQAHLKALLSAACLCCAVPAAAAHLEGRVFEVIDGRTLYVLDGLDTPYVVRLADTGADTGDTGAARQRLSDLIFHKHVHVVWQQVDGAGRLLGRVYVTGPDIVCYDPVCPALIEVGAAR